MLLTSSLSRPLSRRTRKQPVASRLTSTTYTLDIQAVAMDVVLARSSRSNKVSPIKLLSRSLPPLLQRQIYCQDNSCLCNNNFWTAMVDHALQKYTHTHTHTHTTQLLARKASTAQGFLGVKPNMSSTPFTPCFQLQALNLSPPRDSFLSQSLN